MKSIVNFKRRVSRHIKVPYVSLAAGVLVLIFFGMTRFGSTYAWLYNSVTINTGGHAFKTAEVDLIVSQLQTNGYQIYSFTAEALQQQMSLYTDITERNGDVADGLFTQWCMDTDFKSSPLLTESYGVMAKMSLAQRSYDFENESTIPVYFKIDKPLYNAYDMEIALAAYWSTDREPQPQKFRQDGNVFYIDRPLAEDEKYIKVTYTVLLLSLPQNSCDIILLESQRADIIQATNNAVFFSEDWRSFAYNLSSYTDNLK